MYDLCFQVSFNAQPNTREISRTFFILTIYQVEIS